MAYTPNQLFAVKIVNVISGGHKIHDFVFSTKQAAYNFTQSLDAEHIGFVVPVTVNFATE